MSSQKIRPTTRLTKKPDLRIRDVPEWQAALVFDPDQPDLRMINMTSRLIIELCDGRASADIEGQFCSLLGERIDGDNAREKFSTGLRALQDNGLVTAD